MAGRLKQISSNLCYGYRNNGIFYLIILKRKNFMTPNSNALKYCVLDVFTAEKYKGNPLSVIFTENDLDMATYENISREFGYSESSFIYYSSKLDAFKVRSFTPTGFEVNGAGHNLLGAVCTILLKKLKFHLQWTGDAFIIMKDNPIKLFIENSTTDRLPVVGILQQAATIGVSVPIEKIAGAIGLKKENLQSGDFVPTIVKTEVAHLMVPLKDTFVLDEAIPNKELLCRISKEFAFQGVYCFALSKGDPNYLVQTRFFNPGIGIDEDAATGSAVGPLAGLFYSKGLINLNSEHQLLQGMKMKQPSVIRFKVNDLGILISGSSIITMEGEIFV